MVHDCFLRLFPFQWQLGSLLECCSKLPGPKWCMASPKPTGCLAMVTHFWLGWCSSYFLFFRWDNPDNIIILIMLRDIDWSHQADLTHIQKDQKGCLHLHQPFKLHECMSFGVFASNNFQWWQWPMGWWGADSGSHLLIGYNCSTGCAHQKALQIQSLANLP